MKRWLVIALMVEFVCAQQDTRPILFTAAYRTPFTKTMIINSGFGLCMEAGVDPAWSYSGECTWNGSRRFVFKSRTYHRSLTNFGIGMYYEFNDGHAASLFFSNGAQRSRIALKQFTSANFLVKYGREQIVGSKLSYNVL
jgi:hypothetical protein